MQRSDEKLWGALGCLVAVWCFLFVAPLIQTIKDPQRALGVAGFASSLSFGLLAFALGLLANGRDALRAQLGLVRGTLGIPTLIWLSAGMLALSYAVDATLSLTGLRSESSLQFFDRTVAGARGSALLALALGIGIAPGFGEELLFRGFVQNTFRMKLKSVISVIGAALLFGIVHADFAHSLGAFCLGIYLGCVALLDGSLRAAIICHVANNLIVVLAVAFTPAMPRAPASATAATLAGAFAFLTLLGVKWINSSTASTAPRETSPPSNL